MGRQMTFVLDHKTDPYEDGFDFASAHTCVVIGEWAEKLDPKRYKSVRDLFIDGHCEDSVDFVAELEAALKFHPIKDRMAKKVLHLALSEIGIGVPGEHIFIEE